MDVIGCVGSLPVGLSPGGDPLIDGIWGGFAAALGQFWFAVQDVHCVVVGGVLLGGVIAYGSAVNLVVAEREFQREDHVGTTIIVLENHFRGLNRVVACGRIRDVDRPRTK